MIKKKGGGIGEGEGEEKNRFGEKFVQKKYLWFKKGLWENLYSPFPFEEKHASAKRGRGNDKFGKYIALYEFQDKYLFCFSYRIQSFMNFLGFHWLT